MSINAVSSSQNTYQTGLPVNAKQIKTDFENLTAALQSGDMSGAQQAFAALQKDDPQVAKAFAQGGSNSSNPQVSALQSLATALQSGDVTAAQTAMTSLQQAVKGHRGHHHHAAPAAAAPAPSASVNDASTGETSSDNGASLASLATKLNAIA